MRPSDGRGGCSTASELQRKRPNRLLEFGDVPEVIESCLAEVFDVGVKSELEVHFNT